jgi:mitogen-activated protein kinase kinase
MANRASQSPDVDAATAAFKRISLGAPTSQLRTRSGSPLRQSPVLSPGMAARRNKPVFKLSDITGEHGGGDADAGPGAAVPADNHWPSRRSATATSTPFANFGKIVYVTLAV